MNPVKKRFDSRASKRKHKAEEDRKTKLLPSVSKLFKKVSVEISNSNPNVNENLQETHPCRSLSSPVKIEHISQNVTSNANLSSTLVNTISQEIPNTSISSLANNVPNINIFTKLLILPNPTDIGHFNYDNKLSDSQKKIKIKQTTWLDSYDDWDHITIAINRHENSTFYLESCKAYNVYSRNLGIDNQTKKQIDSEAEYWTAILTRVIDVSITLGCQNLSFRGHREDSNTNNPGNFMAIIKLLAKYDPILATLLEKPKGSVKYLSHKIQDQIISLIEIEIKKNILAAVTAAPFFSLILDTTQDIRIPISIEIREDFIGFTEAEGGTGRAMEEQSMKQFKENGLDIIKFRGIGLDGAANMSGKYNGLQVCLRQRQKKAKHVHCASHNLNLIVNDCVKDLKEIRKFCGVLESLYTYFGNSILRWAKLKKESREITRSLKRLCPTRWSSRIDCLVSLNHMYPDIMKVLYRCIDTVVTQMQTRYVGLNEINDLFSCILRRGVISDDDIIIGAKKLADEFEDFNSAESARQIESFTILFSSELKSCNSVFDMTKLLVIENYNQITSFPNLLTTFYLFLTLPVTVASAERSFSKLKLIKNYLRNTMSQTRLSGLNEWSQ
ncbi:Ribonuclease H-like domain,HAT, C-terminal dimerisation domain,Domain of unknown function DUF4371 [Cinara cedri]|uniref:Zinc finger MYM-type protein 1-like n=1 Tax=Cinara cedri TaxID=506608 RepID=A0A5E4MYD4_9HEMI|nr:Ribonuclease H-like domain,HAT, C-terminal dimerisation domain,Domain of unknown function DUF4371 [Cinara cedri]